MSIETDASLRMRARRTIIARNIYLAVVGLWVLAALGMLAIWLATTPSGYFWPVWPIAGWTVAAVAWGIPLFSRRRPRISESRIDAEVNRLRAIR